MMMTTTTSTTTITLRRPSDDADLILNRLDSDATASSSSFVVAPTTASFQRDGNRRRFNRDDNNDDDNDDGGSTSGRQSVVSSTPNSSGPPSPPSSANSPRRRRTFWVHRTTAAMSSRGGGVVSGLKKMAARLRGSAESLVGRWGARHHDGGSRCTASVDGVRRITVEYGNGGCAGAAASSSSPRCRGRRHRARACSVNDLDAANLIADVDNLPLKNLSTSMTMTNICDGVFSAEIPMSVIPSTGDITVRVTNSKMEIFTETSPPPTDDRRRGGKALTSTLLHYCGSVDLPNYVDTACLSVGLDDDGGFLRVEGRMKGCFGLGGVDMKKKKMSISANELRVSGSGGSGGSGSGVWSPVHSMRWNLAAADYLNTSSSWPNLRPENQLLS